MKEDKTQLPTFIRNNNVRTEIKINKIPCLYASRSSNPSPGKRSGTKSHLSATMLITGEKKSVRNFHTMDKHKLNKRLTTYFSINH